MLIHPTKKSSQLFNACLQVENLKNSKVFSSKNPFFSWHGNYYNKNSKKILVLVNDLTYLPVVLYDINAKTKKNLEEYIEKGIRQAFSWSGVTKEKINAYFELAGKIEIGSGHNRTVTSITNMYIQDAQFYPINPQSMFQVDLNKNLANTPISTLKYNTSLEEVAKVFSEELTIKVITENDRVTEDMTNYKINKTWLDFSSLKKLTPSMNLNELENAINQLTENNDKLILSFTDYLKEKEKLSVKTIRRHIENTSLYLNEFLAYNMMHTPLSDFDDISLYIDWYARKVAWGSSAEVSGAGGTLKKLYQFLFEAGEVSQDELKKIKEAIKESVAFTKSYL